MFEYKLTTTFNWRGTILYAGKVQVGYIARKSNKYNVYTHNRKFIASFDFHDNARRACEQAAIDNLEKFEKDA